MRKLKAPLTMELAITCRCNLRCKHCCLFTSPGDVKKDLPTQEWLHFFDELGRYDVMNVILQGAEPFCREDLKEIINGIVRNRMRFNILSNGTRITDEMAAFLASTGRCDFVQISVDGSNPEIHDTLRGKGSFEKAIRGLHILKKHKVPIYARTTIFKKNVDDLEAIAKMLLEDLELPSFSTSSILYLGLSRQNEEIVQLNAEELSRAMEIHIKLDNKYKGRITATAGPLLQAKGWTGIEQLRQEGKEPPHGSGFLSPCLGLSDKLCVRADGVIVSCLLMNHVELGRINHDSLIDIWQNHPEVLKLREQRVKPLKNFKFCKGCEYIAYCRGSCPAQSYSILNDAFQPCSDHCLKRFLEAGGRLPDTKILASADCMCAD